MDLNDDWRTAKLGDRIIAGVIGAVCGFLCGGVLLFPLDALFAADLPLAQTGGAIFGVFGLCAPARSRDFWTLVWTAIIRIITFGIRRP